MHTIGDCLRQIHSQEQIVVIGNRQFLSPDEMAYGMAPSLNLLHKDGCKVSAWVPPEKSTKKLLGSVWVGRCVGHADNRFMGLNKDEPINCISHRHRTIVQAYLGVFADYPLLVPDPGLE